ncbi:MAG: ribosomal protein S18-alanine N-acetyltransferase [Nitrospiraceae bacterium]|nr:ribosomal protein S18-alanine N-acetyltransferase [Nitrospiraceae bacterium]
MAVEELVIEQMGSRHLDEVLAIEKKSYSTPWSALSFKNEIYNPYSIALVAMLGGTVAGYIIANYRFNEGHILNVTVHPGHVRKKIGTHLLELVVDMLRQKQCRVVYLEVRASNLGARHLYERLGFREVGRRKFYYTDPFEDAVLMTLEF